MTRTLTGKDGKCQSYELDRTPRTDRMLNDHLAALKKNPGDFSMQLQVAMDYLALADDHKWNYLENAAGHLRKVLKAFPDNPFVSMQLGRAVGGRALDTQPSTFQRLRWAREGYKYMDRAVRLAPNDVFLRLLRAEAQLLSHPILRRHKPLQQDARRVRDFMTGDAFAGLPDMQKARMHLFVGNFLQKSDSSSREMFRHWELARVLGKDTPIAEEASARKMGRWQSVGYAGE